nr:MAG TPA: hypothetical protein [Crassvirales sp.]
MTRKSYRDRLIILIYKIEYRQKESCLRTCST